MRHNVKSILTQCGKIVLAGVLALTVLSLCCLFYLNKPIFLGCEDGVTDSKYESNSRYCMMDEGLSYGRTNNDGYTDLRDFDGTPVDVLLMGGSHMQALEVPQDRSTASLLDAMLPEEAVYHIGMSAHYLPVCASNLAAAMQKYSPSKYVVIETGNILFSQKELSEYVQDSRTPSAVNTSPLYKLLRSNGYIHLVVNQLQDILKLSRSDGEEEEELADAGLVSQALGKMAETVRSDRGGGKTYHRLPSRPDAC